MLLWPARDLASPDFAVTGRVKMGGGLHKPPAQIVFGWGVHSLCSDDPVLLYLEWFTQRVSGGTLHLPWQEINVEGREGKRDVVWDIKNHSGWTNRPIVIGKHTHMCTFINYHMWLVQVQSSWNSNNLVEAAWWLLPRWSRWRHSSLDHKTKGLVHPVYWPWGIEILIKSWWYGFQILHTLKVSFIKYTSDAVQNLGEDTVWSEPSCTAVRCAHWSGPVALKRCAWGCCRTPPTGPSNQDQSVLPALHSLLTQLFTTFRSRITHNMCLMKWD